MRIPIMSVVVAAALGTACATDGYTTSGGIYASAYTPDLVTVSPGVSVIADWNEPVFYSDNYYWRHYDNRWWRSPYYNRGWTYATPPYAVSRIERPWSYRHYRPNGTITRRDYRSDRSNQRDYRRDRVRDHRGNRGYRR